MCRSTRRRKFTGRITTDERDVKSNGSSSDSDQEIRKIGKEDDESKHFLNIATHKGIYRYTRMPFGVNSAPAIFQRVMDKVLGDMKNVACFLDDVIVTGRSMDEHMANLEEVLSRFEREGIKVNPDKCKWVQDSVEYLGHSIDKNGIHPTTAHLKAMKEMPSPEN
ncbi:unnamed protein product, partial [Nesidiocoris tenuis]